MTAMHIDRSVWAAAGLSVQEGSRPYPWGDPFRMLMARTETGRRGGAVLTPELVRSLRDWMSWWLGDLGESAPPPSPDAIRLVIDEQRTALREKSAAGQSEEFRSGLAWAENALSAIAIAAEMKEFR